MDDSADPTDALLRRAAEHLTGHPKRVFQAEVTLALCGGSARAAERRFGWGREAVHTGLNELRSGIRCVDNFVAKGRVPVEQANPQLAADVREVVEPPRFQRLLLHPDRTRPDDSSTPFHSWVWKFHNSRRFHATGVDRCNAGG